MKTKKIALLSFLACACLIGGAVGMGANSVSAEGEVAPVVTMRAGASLRVPEKGANADADKDGIKFRAYFDLETVKELKGAKSVGMFIAPAAYNAELTINETNCFGEDAVYCWGGAKPDKKEIVHVDGYACKLTDDATVLTMDASLWNLKPASLDKEFVGVAYLKAGDEYYFAEPAYATPVSVAQKALLNEGDTIYHIEGDEKAPERVEAAYVAPLLGEGKVYNYTENVYKQQQNGEYALAKTAEKEVNVTSFDTEALAVEAPANYVKYDGKSSSMVMNLVGDNTKNVYFNYAGNRFVIWDGDEHVADTSYMQRTAGQDLIGTHIGNGMYEGNYARIWGVDGWDGPSWTGGFVLPAATDTLSVIVRVPTETFSNWQLWRDNAKTPKTYSVQNLEDGTIEEHTAPFDLAKGLYKITMTWADSFTTIKEFVFKAHVAVAWHLDNICAEVKAVGTTDVPHVFSDTLTFPAPEVIDTTIWEGETSDLTPVVTYKSNLASEPTNIDAVDGVYTITPAEGAYKYEVVINGTKYIAVKGQHFVDFSLPVAERKVIAKKGYGTNYDNADTDENALSTTPYGTALWATDWRYAHYKLLVDMKPGWDNVVGFTPTKIGMWIYTSSAATITGKQIWFVRNNAYGVATETYTSTAGEYFYFELTTFSKTISNDYAIGFACPAGTQVIEIILIP